MIRILVEDTNERKDKYLTYDYFDFMYNIYRLQKPFPLLTTEHIKYAKLYKALTKANKHIIRRQKFFYNLALGYMSCYNIRFVLKEDIKYMDA